MAGRLGLMVGLCMQGDQVCVPNSSDGGQKSENLGKRDASMLAGLPPPYAPTRRSHQTLPPAPYRGGARSLQSRCSFAKTRREAKCSRLLGG
jgi:hypothetical protein